MDTVEVVRLAMDPILQQMDGLRDDMKETREDIRALRNYNEAEFEKVSYRMGQLEGRMGSVEADISDIRKHGVSTRPQRKTALEPKSASPWYAQPQILALFIVGAIALAALAAAFNRNAGDLLPKTSTSIGEASK